MRLLRGRRRAWIVGLLALSLPGLGPLTPVDAGRATVHLRTNEAFAPCLGQAVEAFSRESATNVVIDLGDPDPPRSADLVVGDDSELTRLLEGGAADLGTSFDLGYLPWVVVVPAGSPVGEVSAIAPGQVSVMGGRAGREARESLRGMTPDRLRLSRDAGELRAAKYALVPRSLAGAGQHRRAEVRPLVATAALIVGGGHPAAARQLLAFLRTERAHRMMSSCLATADEAGVGPDRAASPTASYARSVMDWWLPECSLRGGRYNDPVEVLGSPDAANTGGKDLYRGLMSLGQGGWVVVDMGDPAVDGQGADIRVYQATSNEPVTLYASASAQGPFALVGLRVTCGTRTPGIFSNHCDFDLRGAGLAEARYLRVEDGEIYPCLAAGTVSEGADIDAIELLNRK